MLIKKNFCTKIIWVIYVILTFGILLVTSIGITDRLGNSGDVIYIGISYFVILISAEAIYGLSLLFKKFNLDDLKLTPNKFLEFIYLLFVSILMIMVRFIYLVNNGDNVTGTMDYYNMALSGNMTSAGDISPLAYTYTALLNSILSNITPSTVVCMYIQIVFHLITFLCVYFSLRYLISRIAGVIGSAMFAFLVFSINDVSSINPGAFFNAVFSITFMMIVYSCYLSNRNKLNRFKLVLYFSIAGLFSGFLAYLDYSGIIFFIVGIVFILFLKNSNRNRRIYSPKLQIPIYVIFFILGFVISYLVRSIINEQSFISLLVNDYNFHNYVFKINLFVDAPAYGTYFSAVLVGLSFLWLFRIFAIERDYASPMILFTCFVCLLSLLSLSRDGYISLMTLLYIHLATYGFISLGKNTISALDVAQVESETVSIENRIKEDKENSFKEKEIKRKELNELRKKEKEIIKENKMQRKNNMPNGVNTTLTVANDALTEAENNLDFLKEKRNLDNIQKNVDNKQTEASKNGINDAAKESNANKSVPNQNVSNSVASNNPVLGTPIVNKGNPVLGSPVVNKNSVSTNNQVVSQGNPVLGAPLANQNAPTAGNQIINQNNSVVGTQNVNQNNSIPDVPNVNQNNPVLGAPNVTPNNPVLGSSIANQNNPVLGGPNTNQNNSVLGGPNTNQNNPVLGGPNTSQNNPVLGTPVVNQNNSVLGTSNVNNSPSETVANNNQPSVNNITKQEKPVLNAQKANQNNPVLGAPIINNNVSNPAFVQVPIHSNVTDSNENGKNETNTERKVVSVLSDDAKKFGKHMGYKTAIVKSSSSIDLNKPAENSNSNKDTNNQPNGKQLNVNSSGNNNFTPIKNPLPTPPKHIPREMDFDVIPSESDMHFDIVDLKGKDFFDIN